MTLKKVWGASGGSKCNFSCSGRQPQHTLAGEISSRGGFF
jgi:hypothetical protein